MTAEMETAIVNATAETTPAAAQNTVSWEYFAAAVLVMALVTYLIRMVPLTFFRKPIKSRFVRSFLYYVPYAVLAAMTIPGVLYSTGFEAGGDIKPLIAAAFGLLVGIVLAWFKRGLLTVAVGCCAGVALAQLLFLYI